MNLRRFVLSLSILLCVFLAWTAFDLFQASRQELRDADRDVVVLAYLGVYKPLGYALLSLIVLGLGVAGGRSPRDEGKGEKH